jgi:hypothetical protein
MTDSGKSLLDDQSRRWRQGQGLAVEDYLRRQPSLQADPELLLDLIYHEIVLRERHGELPQLDDYRARFPHLAEQLQVLFEIHDLAVLESPEPGSASVGSVNDPQRTVSYQQETDRAVWYYARGREKLGPFTGQQLRQLAADGVVRPDVMVWQQGMPRWLPARSVPGLFAATDSEPSLPAVRGYEVLDVLGQGGMGVVYKARQLGLNRTVALKMIRSAHLAGPDALDRFRREAEAVARLRRGPRRQPMSFPARRWSASPSTAAGRSWPTAATRTPACASAPSRKGIASSRFGRSSATRSPSTRWRSPPTADG